MNGLLCYQPGDVVFDCWTNVRGTVESATRCENCKGLCLRSPDKTERPPCGGCVKVLMDDGRRRSYSPAGLKRQKGYAILEAELLSSVLSTALLFCIQFLAILGD